MKTDITPKTSAEWLKIYEDAMKDAVRESGAPRSAIASAETQVFVRAGIRGLLSGKLTTDGAPPTLEAVNAEARRSGAPPTMYRVLGAKHAHILARMREEDEDGK